MDKRDIIEFFDRYADELALIMGTELEIIVNIANNRMYQVTGVNKLEV